MQYGKAKKYQKAFVAAGGLQGLVLRFHGARKFDHASSMSCGSGDTSTDCSRVLTSGCVLFISMLSRMSACLIQVFLVKALPCHTPPDPARARLKSRLRRLVCRPNPGTFTARPSRPSTSIDSLSAINTHTHTHTESSARHARNMTASCALETRHRRNTRPRPQKHYWAADLDA